MKGRLIIGALALSSFAPLAFASLGCDILRQTYLGVEAIQNYQTFQGGFGKDLFAKSAQDYSAFIGSKFSEHFGAEFGYEFQPTKSKDSIIQAGNQLPGLTPLTGNEFDGINSSYRASHPYLGLFAEYVPTNIKIGTGNVVFQALVGVSFSQVKANITRLVNDGGVVSPSIVNSFSRRKTVAMVKISAAANLTDNLGLRLSLIYRNMHRFNIVSNLPAGTTLPLTVKMNDAFGIGLGLRYKI